MDPQPLRAAAARLRAQAPFSGSRTGIVLKFGLNWGVLFVHILKMRALLFGVYIRAPDFRNSPIVLIWVPIS